MQMQFNIKGGEEILSKELEAMAKKCDNETIGKAIKNASFAVQEGIRQRVSATRTTSKGNLAKSINFRLKKEFNGRVYMSVFGWKKVLVRNYKKGTAAYTTDYGPVLEFDQKRQLRHLHVGFEDKQPEAVNRILKYIQKELNSVKEK